MSLARFDVFTPKGLGECVIAFASYERTWWDHICRRTRYAYGLGVCSPFDYQDNYVEGKTEELAYARLSAYWWGRRGKSLANGFTGTFKCRHGKWRPLFDEIYSIAASATHADVRLTEYAPEYY